LSGFAVSYPLESNSADRKGWGNWNEGFNPECRVATYSE
jgi:hypothetical protein